MDDVMQRMGWLSATQPALLRISFLYGTLMRSDERFVKLRELTVSMSSVVSSHAQFA
jgi:hypothetical protein